MKLKKSHTIVLVFGVAFLFAYLTSGSSKKVGIETPSTKKEEVPKAEVQNSEIVENSPPLESAVIRQPGFAPSYVPRPGSARVGPTPGIVGTTISPDYYNPYAELTNQMRSRQGQAGNQPTEANSQRNLYFETLSQQLKDLEGNKEKPANTEPMPTSGLTGSSNPAGIEAPRRGEALDRAAAIPNIDEAPVDPFIGEEIIDESGGDITDEQLEQILDDQDDGSLVDAEIEKILQEEGY